MAGINRDGSGALRTRLHGSGARAGMILRRAQRATLTAGARPVTTRGRRGATRGRKHIKTFGKFAATDGMANEEIPGQMVERAVSKGPGSWSGSYVPEDAGVAWNGWAHYENGGFQGDWNDRRGHSGGGRASEKLAVPSFSGDDTDDVGGSARSYLRQVEAWRRMTLLPATQQGLVLYQNLSGKAWIAAEELSVPRLASEGGVSYFVSWINARFLDRGCSHWQGLFRFLSEIEEASGANYQGV